MWEVLLCLCLTALAFFIQVHIVEKVSKTKTFANKEGHGTLAGQLKFGTSNAILPNPKGAHRYRIEVSKGMVRLNHHSYTHNGRQWSFSFGFGEEKYLYFNGRGIYTYTIDIGENSGKTDAVELVNMNLKDDIEFNYKID